MKKEKTLIMIKPDGVQKKLIGEALRRFEREGLDIIHLEVKQLKKPTVKKFYAHLKPMLHPKLFNEVIKYISSGKVVFGILEGENASKRVRALCGPTNPKEASKGTIRGDFGEGDMNVWGKKNKAIRNVIHSSESHKHAKKEFKILRGK